MKILRLELLNLASLDNPNGEVIDFESGVLAQSSIFSIVGPTGSGKSTILDAICLALYGLAPRYPRKKGGRGGRFEIFGTPDEGESNRLAPTDCRNILARGTKRGFSKLTFLANDGKTYRAEWHVEIKRTKFSNAVTRLYQVGDTTETEIEWHSIPTIIGLEYEQFLRTVLIAQGAFANFLTSSEDERYALLEKLIGCEETYASIAENIKASKREAEDAFGAIDVQISSVRDHIMEPEALQRCVEQRDELTAQATALANRVKESDDQLAWYAADEKLAAEIDTRQAALDNIRKEAGSRATEFEEVRLYVELNTGIDLAREGERLKVESVKVMRSIASNQDAITEISKKQADVSTQVGIAKKDVTTADARLADAEPRINMARQLKERIENIRKQKRDATADAAKKDGELAAIRKEIEVNRQNTLNADKLAKKASEELAVNAEAAATQRAALVKVFDDATAAHALELKKIEGQDLAALQDANKVAANRTKALNDAKKLLTDMAVLAKECGDKAVQADALTKRNGELSAQLGAIDVATLENDVEVLRNAWTLMSSEDWRRHRAALTPGEECPLCGSKHHPFAIDKESVDIVISKTEEHLNAKVALLKEAKDCAQSLRDSITANEVTIKLLQSRIAEIDASQRQAQQHLTSLRHGAEWIPATLAEIDAAAPDCEAAEAHAAAMLNAYVQVQKRVAELQAAKDASQAALHDYDLKVAATTERLKRNSDDATLRLAQLQAVAPRLLKNESEKLAECEDCKKRLDEISADESRAITEFNAQLSGADPDATEATLKAQCDTTRRLLDEKENEAAKIQTDLAELQGQRRTLDTRLSEIASETKLNDGQIASWIANYNNTHAHIDRTMLVRFLLDTDRDWEKIRLEKESLDKAEHQAAALLCDATKKRREHSVGRPSIAKDEIDRFKAELAEATRHNGEQLLTVMALIKQHEDSKKILGDKLEEYNRLKQDLDDWNSISAAIGPDGKILRRVAQCHTLSFLVRHANEEIRKFNRRYELVQVKNSLGIRVIDHDMADDIRDTTSLSGGETFIVSLGLALGLASLSSRNLSFRNLFIDEGFGSLDADTLATVIDSLAMLQSSQGKKVGIISHTETMSERISTQIRIVKKGNTGSSRIEIAHF